MVRCAFILAVVAVFLGMPAFAQETAPTADQVKDALAKYKAERAEAAKTFKPDELTAGDELAAKAEKALASENTQAALRLAGEARWQVPFMPAGLPEKVSRVLGAARMRHGDRVNTLAYSPDGTLLASASRDGTVRLWDVGNGREVLTYRGHEANKFTDDNEKEKVNVLRVPSVAFSQDGTWVASCGALEIHVWETKTGKKLHTLKGHKKDVISLAFGKDKNRLASAGDDKKLMLWDVAAEKADFTSDDQNLQLSQVVFAPTDKSVGTVNRAGDMMIFGVDAMGKNPKLTLSTGVSDNGPSNTLAFTRDGAGIFTAGQDTKIKLTAGPEGMPGFAAATVVRKFEGHTKAINSIAVSKDGSTIVSGSHDQTVIVWDVATGKLDRVFQGHIQPVISVAIRPDGKQVASGSEDGSIRLWPLNKSDEHRAMTEAKENLWAVAFGDNGATFASAGADRIVRVYDAVTGKLSKELPGHKGAVTSLAYLGNDRIVSGSGDKLLKIWNVAAGTAQDCAGHTSAVLSIAASDKLIVSGGADRTARGWGLDGKALWSWASKSAVCAVAIKKDGKKIALGCADGTLIILTPDGDKEPKPTASIVGHTGGGTHTVEQLIAVENETNPLRGDGHEKPLTRMKVDAGLLDHLRQAGGRRLTDVPAAGERVLLRGTANLSTGGTARDVTDEVHPDVRRLCERATRVVGLDVFGIDLIAPTVSDPLPETGAGVIEVNAAPGLRMHHFPSAGTPRDVGGAVVRMLFPTGDGRIPVISITGTNGKTTVPRMTAGILAAASARAVGVSAAVVRRGLGAFGTRPDCNPGRMNVFEVGCGRVLVDYGHNPAALDAVAAVARRLEVKEVVPLNVRTREQALDVAAADPLRHAGAVFLTGGDQLRLTSQLGGTPVLEAIRRVYADGGVIAGTSAGASVQADTMMVSGEGASAPRLGDALRLAPGFSFLTGVIIDQHFAERGRMGRLLAAVTQNPESLGLDIDEDTVVVVERSRFRVVGAGGVYVFDAAAATFSNVAEAGSDETLSVHDVTLHALGPATAST